MRRSSFNLDTCYPSIHHVRYGGSSRGWLRGELEPQRFIITKEGDLNQTGLIIVVYKQSIQDVYATQNLQAATIIRAPGNDECFAILSSKQAHVMIGEATDLYAWLNLNTTTCHNCTIRAFSTPYTFGSFVANVVSWASGMHVVGVLQGVVFLLVILAIPQ